MAEIVLTTFNARYAHAAFGLRYLLANLGPLRHRAKILEFEITQRPLDVVEAILAEDPKIVGLGVYIWNAAPSAQLVAELKRLRPDLQIVLGGPEVSYETDRRKSAARPIMSSAARPISPSPISAKSSWPANKPLVAHPPADLARFVPARSPLRFLRRSATSPIASSTSKPRAAAPSPANFASPRSTFPCAMSRSIPFSPPCSDCSTAACNLFKFVDRTFNLNLNFSRAILEFFLDRYPARPISPF